jgi:hypothetical protein
MLLKPQIKALRYDNGFDYSLSPTHRRSNADRALRALANGITDGLIRAGQNFLRARFATLLAVLPIILNNTKKPRNKYP